MQSAAPPHCSNWRRRKRGAGGNPTAVPIFRPGVLLRLFFLDAWRQHGEPAHGLIIGALLIALRSFAADTCFSLLTVAVFTGIAWLLDPSVYAPPHFHLHRRVMLGASSWPPSSDLAMTGPVPHLPSAAAASSASSVSGKLPRRGHLHHPDHERADTSD